MRENNVQVGPEVDKYVSEHDNLAQTCVLVSSDGKIAGSFAVTDPVKPEAARVISYLHVINITSIKVTGDNWAIVAASAKEVGIDKVYAETDPLGKADRIKELQSDLEGVVTAVDLSRKIMSRIRLNYVWALGYNILSMPVAAGVLFPFTGIRLPPWLAGACLLHL